MALSISSPGVQINEIDLSLRASNPTGTNVVVPGFAPQGPTSEPLLITTVSELESVYGTPLTPAERYFYYSCKEVLNSPATLTTIRLPYGSDLGTGFSSAYGGLFFPMTSGNGGWTIGAPIHKSLSIQDVQAIEAGNFVWGSTTAAAYTTGHVSGGFVVINDLQTTINELGEGYYVAVSDRNISLSGYNSVNQILTLSAADAFASIPTSREDFILSATHIQSDTNITSVSESLQTVGYTDFATADQYSSFVSVGLFKLKRSTVDSSQLSISKKESYIGSFDQTSKLPNSTGGTLVNTYITEVINEASPSLKVFVNPVIAESNWTTLSSVTVSSSAKNLYAAGAYIPENRNATTNKIIGNVPGKLDQAFRSLESLDNITIDVVIDAGLSTIYSTSQLSQNSFDDTTPYVQDLSTLNDNWNSVAAFLINFAENTRKDCMVILDPTRQIFVQGRDTKTLSVAGNTFTEKIYSPLKNLTGQYPSNYVATYANWVKVKDIFSGKNIWVPFSGYAAAVYARNDQAANAWSAPAGLNRGTFLALDIAFNPNQKQRDRLYEMGVNPVVFFNGDGYAIYGQKTLQTKPTAFDRINVRRLFLALERATNKVMKYFVMEPNTQITRTRVRNTLAPIFDYAKNTQGLYDYLIVVDERNNTAATIDQNQLIVDIYLKPVKTAEFILVNFVATRSGQDFNELI
jgi:hypothetical protein